MEEEQDNLRVLTLNCWGIPYISKDVKKRFFHIAKELTSGKYDIVSLQEVWSQSDYEYLCTVVADVLPYTVYFYSGVIGSGVCVLSKYPIIDTFTYRFSLNGYLYMVHHGDWYGGKSVGYCVIEHPKQHLHFFTTHLHARYNHRVDKYLAHRTVQAFQLAEFIQHLTKPSDYVIVCGDMNSEPDDPCYRVIKHLPCLIDSWEEAGSKDGFHGNTCVVSTNSYSPDDVIRSGSHGNRIDYILYRSPSYDTFQCIDCHVTMGRIPGENISYSDHEGVLATFIVKPSLPSALHDPKGSPNQQAVLTEIADIIQDGILNSTPSIKSYLVIIVLFVLVFLPLAYIQAMDSPCYVISLHVIQIILAMFLSGYIYHVVLVSREEHQAYSNVEQEVQLQMRQLNMKKSVQ